jgi:hypothetical protein
MRRTSEHAQDVADIHGDTVCPPGTLRRGRRTRGCYVRLQPSASLVQEVLDAIYITVVNNVYQVGDARNERKVYEILKITT